ncbi:fimbrial biogenesis usher protein [Enterobacter sp. RIT418]|uniref:fimbrial biogenesis usher protein n=1 Tax=Enterobacter sp. RIT418 TaxID=2202164 RepID=UPI000D48734B|nr:fimbrial biogenesis usher protein [Enterobacter sp. RIT 418]RAU36190.1 fimbrial biogenesis outer membrane usher protein [Enterobacter sp. RIT 418]
MKGFLAHNRLQQAAFASAFLPVLTLHAAELDFNTDILTNRGISTNLAHYFSEAQRFLPGKHALQVKINGVDKGMLAVEIGEEGHLCADNDFTAATGLLPLKPRPDETCHDLLKDYPSATITPKPNTDSIELFVPAEAMDNGFYSAKYYSYGGVAGLINYSAFSNYNQYGSSGSSTYTQGNIGTGINAANWTLRSHYILTDDNGQRSAENLYTYAEHVFEARKVRAQVGQINVSSALFSGAQITGLQLLPETGLQPNIPSTTITGIARSNQARVEIRQSGQVIYSSMVNAGPFTLTDVPVVRGNSDLDVSVIETNGATTRFTVPASSLNLSGFARSEGLSLSLGRVRDSGSAESSPWVFNASTGTRLAAQLSGVTAGVLAEKYQAAGGMLEWSINDDWMISSTVLLSQSDFYGTQRGGKAELMSNLLLPSQLSLGLSATQYQGDFREFTEAMDEGALSAQNAWSANLSWSHDLLGAVSFQYSATSGYEQGDDSRYLLASWSKSRGHASLSVNWQHAMNNSSGDDTQSRDDDLFYVNLNLPFGAERISTYVRSQGENKTYGAQLSGNVSQNVSYSLSADRDHKDKSNAFYGNLNSNLHYTQLGLSAGVSDGDQRSYSTSLSGGIALHRHGMTFTPYPIKETFGIARLSEPESGIEISTPDGTVWTDYWGQAVVPGLREWQKSQIVINTGSLPKGMDLSNGIQSVSAAYGSFAQVDFRVLNTRRVLLEVKRESGEWLDRGLSIVDSNSHYVVSVMDNGIVFISDASGTPALYVVDDRMNRICEIHYSLSDEKDKDAYYEKAQGVCR